MSKSVNDTYKSIVENYDYFNMYPPIDVTSFEKRSQNIKSSKDVSKGVYNRYIEDYDYATDYIPPSVKNPTNIKDLMNIGDLTDVKDAYVKRVEQYEYVDENTEQDPDELLRTAEDHIERLNMFIKEMNRQLAYLLGENQDNRQLLEKLKKSDERSELISELQSQSKKLQELENELRETTEVRDHLIVENKRVIDENKSIKSGNLNLRKKLDDFNKLKEISSLSDDQKIRDSFGMGDEPKIINDIDKKKHRYGDEREGEGEDNVFSRNEFHNKLFSFGEDKTPSKKKQVLGRKRRY